MLVYIVFTCLLNEVGLESTIRYRAESQRRSHNITARLKLEWIYRWYSFAISMGFIVSCVSASFSTVFNLVVKELKFYCLIHKYIVNIHIYTHSLKTLGLKCPCLTLARVQAQGKNSEPASKTRYFVLSAFAHERSILIGCLLLDSIIRSVIHHKGSR